MKTMGINLIKGFFYYAILDGSKQNPRIIEKNKLSTITTVNVPELMDWYCKTFNALLQLHHPTKIAYRFHLNPNKNQITYIHYPLGLLCYMSYMMQIPINSYPPQSYVASKLNMPKGTDLIAYCDQIFGSLPPYWDTNMKYAILSAWFDL
jgi:hypothetical protein